MGFETVVSGYIAVEGEVATALRAIAALPLAEQDDWPFLPREAFNAGALNPMIAYKGRTVLAFGMCVKEINHEWSEWLEKFERLLGECGADAAFVALEIPYWDSGEWGGRFFYSWQRVEDGYEFKGEPRRF